MKTIWKYTLKINGVQELSIPKNGQILSVQIQHGKPQLWVLVDQEEQKESVILHTYGTGHPVEGENLTYIDTFQIEGGALVFHVFKKF